MPTKSTKKTSSPKKTTEKLKYLTSVGRRKSAVARVRLYILEKGVKSINIYGSDQKIGSALVNKLPIEKYFQHQSHQAFHDLPLKVTDTKDKFVICAHLKGGGVDGQIEAYVLGLSRALQKYDNSHTTALRNERLLTVDARVRERRKVGTGGKARRAKQSPKR